MNLLEELGNAIWFILPAYFASISPVWFSLQGKTRLDLGRSFRNKPILGPSKTVKGFLGGSLLGSLLGLVQEYVFGKPDGFLLGILLGFGAMIGDVVKSFFKRLLNIPPGAPWFPFDQIDFLIGALLLASLVKTPSLIGMLILIIVTPPLHKLSNILDYHLGLKEVPH